VQDDLDRPTADRNTARERASHLALSVNLARLQDAMLGGKEPRSAERELRRLLLATAPDLQELFVIATCLRNTAVERLATTSDVKQWIHCAPGFPSPGSDTHELVQKIRPEARVLYVSNDPAVAVFSQAVRAVNDRVQAIRADFYEPRHIREHADVGGLLKWDQPIGLIYGADWASYLGNAEQGVSITKQFTAELAPGSYAIRSHFQQPSPGPAADQVERLRDLLAGCLDHLAWFQPRSLIEAYFANQHITAPGLVNIDGVDPGTAPTAAAQLAAWAVCGTGRITQDGSPPPAAMTGS
jgi:hypothetical protein